jgi:acyl carrier protein
MVPVGMRKGLSTGVVDSPFFGGGKCCGLVNEYNAPDSTAVEDFRRLIEESPLGAPGARELRERVPRSRAERIVRRLAEEQRQGDPDDGDPDDDDDVPVGDLLFAQQLQELFSQQPAPPTTARRRRGGPTEKQIIADLAEVIEVVTGIVPSEITPEKSFVDDLDIDSLSMVEIAVQAEYKYGVKIPDEDLAGLRTVGDVVDYIQKLEEAYPEAAAPDITAVSLHDPWN